MDQTGIIGLGFGIGDPNANNIYDVFLNKMINDGAIDNGTFSLSVSPDESTPSEATFGGYNLEKFG
jgi:hypothetical protein